MLLDGLEALNKYSFMQDKPTVKLCGLQQGEKLTDSGIEISTVNLK